MNWIMNNIGRQDDPRPYLESLSLRHQFDEQDA
jgi:hypothetical protein